MLWSVCDAPIISQDELSLFVKKFVRLMPEQFLALWSMLNFNENNHLKRRMHLQAFYLQMVLYQFISMNRVRNSKSFSWWALCNSAARYGSHDVQARSNLSTTASPSHRVHSNESSPPLMTMESWWRLAKQSFLSLAILVYWCGTIHSWLLH